MNGIAFLKLAKFDERSNTIEGVATAEEADRDGEILDYDSSKPYFEDWSENIRTATDGKSLGNIREMHQTHAVGKVIKIIFDDINKLIRITAKIIDPGTQKKIQEGVLTGLSIGGRVIRKWRDGALQRYTASPSEISVVDFPALPSATFAVVKFSGALELRKFQTKGDVVMKQHAQLFGKRAESHRAIAQLHKAKSDDVNTSRADLKFHKALADQHEALARSEEAQATLCEGGTADSSKVFKTTFAESLPSESGSGTGEFETMGCGL